MTLELQLRRPELFDMPLAEIDAMHHAPDTAVSVSPWRACVAPMLDWAEV